jgi:hypothetical protein
MNIAKSVFVMQLGIMKNLLTLFEFKFGGRDSDQYKYVKEQIMNYVYEGLKKFYQEGVELGIFEKCPCGANLRKGFRNCECGGSGFHDKIKK